MFKMLMVCDVQAIERFRFYSVLDRFGSDLDQLHGILAVDASNIILSVEHIVVSSVILLMVGFIPLSVLALVVMIALSIYFYDLLDSAYISLLKLSDHYQQRVNDFNFQLLS